MEDLIQRVTEELVEKVKNECSGLFIEARDDCNPCFGVDEGFQMSKHIQLCSPDVNYSQFSWSYINLPKPLKQWISKPDSFYDAFGRENLYIFHYPINMERVQRELKAMEKEDIFLWEKVKHLDPKKRGPHRAPIDSNQYYEKIVRKYGDSSCIQMNLWNYARLWGNKRTMQEIIDVLKTGSETPFEIMRRLMSEKQFEQVDDDLKCVRSVHLYDLLGKPKEVHYQR